jgi:hypothetical protein
VFGLACGYADCNDAARLADDPLHKLLVERDPIAGAALASQPTLSRFENAVGRRELIAMGHVLADTVIAHHRRRLKGRATRITIDLDPTDDPTHGQQEFSSFNGHYDTWCYLPLVATVTFNDEAEQVAVAAVLRPGTAPASLGARGLLRRLLGTLRPAFPAATFRVRLDGGFATPKVFAFLEAQSVEYVVAMASNVRLEQRARRLMGKARMRSKASGQTAHLYGETRYAARTWRRQRRVLIKAEVVRHPGRDPKNNPRFLVTNLPDDPQTVYEQIYCPRGDMENRLKELHHGLELDRTSCSRFLANQFRVLLTLAAYVHAAGAADQARRVDRAFGVPDRPALAGDLPVAPDLASARARRRGDLVTRSATPRRGVTPGLVSSRASCRDAPHDRIRPLRSASCASRRQTPSRSPRHVRLRSISGRRSHRHCPLMNNPG